MVNTVISARCGVRVSKTLERYCARNRLTKSRVVGELLAEWAEARIEEEYEECKKQLSEGEEK